MQAAAPADASPPRYHLWTLVLVFSDMAVACCCDKRLLASAIITVATPNHPRGALGLERKMAEVVNRIVESMLPELEELQRAGLFNEEEIR